MPSPVTLSITRCCDAQGAGAEFSHNAMPRRLRYRVITRIVRRMPLARRVPVVVMLRAPVPLFFAKMPFLPPVVWPR